jgi:hypothetical protein
MQNLINVRFSKSIFLKIPEDPLVDHLREKLERGARNAQQMTLQLSQHCGEGQGLGDDQPEKAQRSSAAHCQKWVSHNTRELCQAL